jgi:hypothetical protein
MRKIFLLFPLIISILLMSSCASVKICSGSGAETGLRFYTVKPYLLVELQSEKDNTVKTTVVYLPDLADPQYIFFKPGFGSNEVKMTFTNSALNSYGSVSESQIPETINAIASLISKGADAATTFTAPPNFSGQPISSEIFKLYEIVFDKEGTSLREVNLNKL